MQRPVIIVNPRSGGGLNPNRWAALVPALTDGLGPFDVRFTEGPGDGRRLAAEETKAGRKLVVAMGGDGTISEVADGILAAGGTAEMGVIPRGTGGDFRRTLGLDHDLAAAAARVRTGKLRTIDAGRVSFVRHDGSRDQRHFVNVVSFGFSSDVARRANQASKRLGGRVAFLSATLKSLVSYDNADLLLSVDGQPEQRMRLMLAALGNGRYFGGGMRICPDAILDDGLLDVTLVGDLSRAGVLSNMHRLYAGTHLSMKKVHGGRARHIRITPADPAAEIPLEIDGETPGRLPATVELLPSALKLRS